jgi:ABC-type nitrate/sulfonate/bicarbonate transport system substrate-binding protein
LGCRFWIQSKIKNLKSKIGWEEEELVGGALVAGYATIGQGAGPMIVTQRAGIFAKHGLDVETRLMDGAKGVVKGLMQGEIMFGNLAAPTLLRADLVEGADLLYLTGGINQQFLVGRPGIEHRNQLAGARVGFAGDGGLNNVLVYYVIEQLEKQGIGDIRLAPVPGGGREGLVNLIARQCDALVMTPPEAIEARRQGCVFLVDFAEFGLNYALGGIATRLGTVEREPDITKKFIQAYVEGMHRYRTDRDFTVQVQQEYSGIADRSIAEETYDLTQPGMPKVPYPRVDALAKALKVMSRELPKAATADPHSFVDDRFIRELEESGFVRELYGRR